MDKETTDMTTTLNSRNAQHFADALTVYKEAKRELALTPMDDNAETECVTDRLCAAEAYLMDHAAPDLPAVLAKFEITTDDARVPDAGWVQSIREDLIRLAGLDRSPTFCALTWLDAFEFRGGKTALVASEDGKPVPQLSVRADAAGAWRMIRDLRPYEQAAVRDHLSAHLDPADYGLAESA